MKRMTEQNLDAAFAGESMAHMRYLIFAERAERERKPNIARLFRAISFAEQAHATNHYRELGMIKTTAENLVTAIEGEEFEVAEMYPAYLEVAKLQEERGAQRSFNYAVEAEKIHAGLYRSTREKAEAGEDIELGTVYICSICGHTVEGEAPDRCPICGARKELYKAF
ncbi:rubrerythrin family protein [Chloroflexota bacterium]